MYSQTEFAWKQKRQAATNNKWKVTARGWYNLLGSKADGEPGGFHILSVSF